MQFTKVLQLAENILESADQRAAVSLSANEESNSTIIPRQFVNDDTSGKAYDCTNSECRKRHQNLQREADRLRSELCFVESKLTTSQKRIDNYENELKLSEREYLNQTQLLERQTTKLLQENHDQAEEIADLNQKMERLANELQSSHDELSRTMAKEENKWVYAASTSSDNEQLIFNLREELSNAKYRLKKEKEKHQQESKAAEERQSEIERVNAELTKQFADFRRKHHAQTATNSQTTSQADLFSSEETTMALHCEREKVRKLEADSKFVRQEMQSIREVTDRKMEKYELDLKQARKVITELTDRIRDNSKTPNLKETAGEKVKQLTSRLLQKQSELNQLKTKFSALEARFAIVHQQLQFDKIKSNDIEIGRPRDYSQRIKTLETSHACLRQMDKYVASFVLFMQMHPLARVFAAVYIMLLQIWSFILLSLHINSIPDE